MALDAADPEQRELIGAVLDASGKGPDRYPALHRDLDAGRSEGVAADDCTIVDMGADSAGRATASSWLASRGGAYISGAATLLCDAQSGRLLAGGTGTQVGGMQAEASTRAAEAEPASEQMTTVTLFHAQTAPEAPPRFGLVAKTRPTATVPIKATVTAPVHVTTSGPNVLIGLSRTGIVGVDYAYNSPVNTDPDRLVCPFVGSVPLPGNADTSAPISAETKLYVNAAKAWLELHGGFSLKGGYRIEQVGGEEKLLWEYPADGKPIYETASIQYGISSQAYCAVTKFFFQFTVPMIAGPPTVLTVCSPETPLEPSSNCTVIDNLEYWWHCLGEDTTVTLADGSELAIRDADTSISVRAGVGDGVAKVWATSRARHDDNGGRDPAYRLQTEAGRALLLSQAHPVVTGAGLVGAGDLRPGDAVLTADGEERVRACEPEAYDGLVYNLALESGPGGFGSFLANGVAVGDQPAQCAQFCNQRHDPDYVLPRLPESHHRDYLSALADASIG